MSAQTVDPAPHVSAFAPLKRRAFRWLWLGVLVSGIGVWAQGLLDVVARKHRDEGLTVVAVFHDLNLAALAAARVVVIDGGEVVADGPPAVALAPAVLARTFGPVMHAVTHPVAGVAQVLPARAPLAL